MASRPILERSEGVGMKIAVVGSTGLIGGKVAEALVARGDEVIAVSRRGLPIEGATALAWDPVATPLPPELTDGVDAVVNMAGRPVAPVRWTEDNKKEMRESRVGTTRSLVEAIVAGDPKVFVNASAVGYYGPSDDPVVESDGPGEDFLADMCLEWEDAAMPATDHGVRVVTVRTGIVLDSDEGALPPLAKATKMFVGGPLAGGRQWFPWIHIDDQIGIILQAIDDPDVVGPINAASPNPVRQKDFARTLGRILKRPSFLPTPAFAMRLLFGEGATAVLNGQPALPAAIEEAGYEFRHPHLEGALRDLLG
jgi:uncharacterized protein (TIGR01777 family)